MRLCFSRLYPGLTVGILSVAYLGAVFIPNIKIAFQFTGATAAVLIGKYIVPHPSLLFMAQCTAIIWYGIAVIDCLHVYWPIMHYGVQKKNSRNLLHFVWGRRCIYALPNALRLLRRFYFPFTGQFRIFFFLSRSPNSSIAYPVLGFQVSLCQHSLRTGRICQARCGLYGFSTLLAASSASLELVVLS